MKIFNEKIKTIVISSLGAFLCIYAIAYLNLIDETNVWLIPPFGASLVLVMAVHDSPLASPRNVFFGHVLSASSGVMIYYFFGDAPIAIALGLGFAIILMLLTNTVHPPAGANPIIAILGAKSYDFAPKIAIIGFAPAGG